VVVADLQIDGEVTADRAEAANRRSDRLEDLKTSAAVVRVDACALGPAVVAREEEDILSDPAAAPRPRES
jgi:hypothetical protein